MNRGSATDSGALFRGVRASMRPRFMNRGSFRDEQQETADRDAASMRPRFMNRGSPVADSLCTPDDWLLQ